MGTLQIIYYQKLFKYKKRKLCNADQHVGVSTLKTEDSVNMGYYYEEGEDEMLEDDELVGDEDF